MRSEEEEEEGGALDLLKRNSVVGGFYSEELRCRNEEQRAQCILNTRQANETGMCAIFDCHPTCGVTWEKYFAFRYVLLRMFYSDE